MSKGKKSKAKGKRKIMRVGKKWKFASGKEVKPVKHQLGKSNKKRDALYKALKPGKRISKNGKIYYEYRRNRSDLHSNE